MSNPTKILKKSCSLRTSTGLIEFILQAIEYDEPSYAIVIAIQAKDTKSNRRIIHLKITNETLAPELKNWLEGKVVLHSALVLAVDVEEEMMRFVKFAKTPSKKNLIMWILSRSLIVWEKDKEEIIFGGNSITNQKTSFSSIANPFPKTTDAAVEQERGRSASRDVDKVQNTTNRKRSSSVPTRLNVTQKIALDLLGTSQALSQLQRKELTGRQDAKVTIVRSNWTDDHFQLSSTIERGRKEVEVAVEERRRRLELTATRQRQTIEKYTKVRERLNSSQDERAWRSEAEYEAGMLRSVMNEVEDDIHRQHCLAHRNSELVRRTMAPHGFLNRGGTWQRGPHLGPGPLPPEATSKLSDPRLEDTFRQYDWDQHGRRHRRHVTDEDSPSSVLKDAMEKIRAATRNTSLYKLDLNGVFRKMDASRDGRLSKDELRHGLQHLGVKIDEEGIDQVFSFFDPNSSGWIGYGEFVFSFFNRREFYRKMRLGTRGKSKQLQESIFRECDRYGDGRLDKKDFCKVLSRLGIVLEDKEIDMVMLRFGDREDKTLDVAAFREFLTSLESTYGQPVLPTSRSQTRRPATATATATATASAKTTTGRAARAADVVHPNDPSVLDVTRSLRKMMSTNPDESDKNKYSTKPSTSSSSSSSSSSAVHDRNWMEKILRRQEQVEAMVGRDLFA